MDRFSAEVQHSLFHDGGLYKAVKSVLLLTQTNHTNGSEMSQNMQAVQSTLDDMRDKFEIEEIDEMVTAGKVEAADSEAEEEVDGEGYRTVDLNTYSDSNLMPIDTGDNSVISSEPVLVNGDAKVILDSEPDLDSTLLADDACDINDTVDHSDIEIDPLTISSQSIEKNAETVHSVSPLSDDHINVDQNESSDAKEVENRIESDTKMQSDQSVTEPVPLTAKTDSAMHPTRSKSKAIPPRSKSASHRDENVDTQGASSNSLSSATPSSLGGHNRISLSEPHSLERQAEASSVSPLSLGGSLGPDSATSSLKSRPKSDFAHRVETALNTQLSVSSVASAEGEDDLIAIPVSQGGSGGASGGAGGGESAGVTGSGGKGKKKKSRKKKNAGALSRRMSNPEIRGEINEICLL